MRGQQNDRGDGGCKAENDDRFVALVVVSGAGK